MSTEVTTSEGYELIRDLTAGSPAGANRRQALLQFARTNGWRPSEEIEDYPGTGDVANGHLLVEHGLDNTAVITFLKNNHPYSHLSSDSRRRLLSLSYNNLVDWHLFPDRHGLTRVFNRTDPPTAQYVSILDNPDVWRGTAFDQVVGRRPNPNIKSLDDALIFTISSWKRRLPAELKHKPKNEEISSLFNCILFVRALEDLNRWRSANEGQLLLDIWNPKNDHPATLSVGIKRALTALGITRFPANILGSANALRVFNSLDRLTVQDLFYNFYQNTSAPYQYDFSVMSKHALSRIYEHYVSLLREKESAQMRLFPDLPEEVENRAIGGFYTPQYIAKFFSRFLKENHTPPVFRQLRIADPTCGSGIFLRSTLEMQCDPIQDVDFKTTAMTAFKNVVGIDVDPNACQATRLSLALLHLVLTDRVPESLNILNAEAVDYFHRKPELEHAFDAVIANPPFIKWERMGKELQDRFRTFMGPSGVGRIDAFLAHLKVGMQMVKPGGFLLYVLPHAFLLGRNAHSLRQEVSSSFWVRFLVDLSEIPVFGDVRSYVILLVLEKTRTHARNGPHATIVRCKQFAGHALQDALEGKTPSNDFYQVFTVPQSVFEAEVWEIMPEKEWRTKAKISKFPTLDKFLVIREGFITGADEVFVRDAAGIPEKEKDIYVPYLRDKAMERFAVPAETDKVVFYPYLKERRITREELQANFPKTWDYLKSHYRSLRSRKSVVNSGCDWWSPVRPRAPKNLMRPKIISPHLTFFPKFCADLEGRFAVSHSPLMYPREEADVQGLLRYFLAILNSTVARWQIVNVSHRYAHGYCLLEPKTLSQLRVPDPKDVPAPTMRTIQELVSKRLKNKDVAATEAKLDEIVSQLYGLNEKEMGDISIRDDVDASHP